MRANPLAAVAMGASAGGVKAVIRLLRSMGADFAPPVLLVQHVHRHVRSSVADFIGRESGVRTIEVEDHQAIEPRTVHLAPANYHMLVESTETLVLTVDALVHHSRPSVDVLLQSAAEVFGPSLAGVVLTGASEDGALGLKSVRDAGGWCFVEDPETAEVPLMPRTALTAVPTARALPVEELGACLRELQGGTPTRGVCEGAPEGVGPL